MQDNFLSIQKRYWNTLASSIQNDVAVTHCVDENNKAVGEVLFEEIAVFLKNEFLEGKNNANILEIGCGNGLILKYLNKIKGQRYNLFGCDLSEQMLARILLDKVSVYCTEASNIPCENEKFDLVYMNTVVQYFDNQEYLAKVLKECLRILKPGGGLCIMDVPCKWYEEYMSSNDLIAKVRRKIARFAEKWCKSFLEKHRKSRTVINENVHGVFITAPAFRGLYTDPDTFFAYKPYFEHVSVEVQPFKYKPLVYRKFRFNILMKGKKSDNI